LGNSSVSWGAQSPEWCALTDINTSFSLGQFLWTGQDYIGEPTPYHTKNSYFGHIDTAGFAKDSYFVYKAAWTEEPFIHLFPYWDHSPGQAVDVRAATNAHSAELFLNGGSLGRKELGGRLIADWSVPYRPGELSVKAYASGGAVIAEAVRHSFGDPAGLALSTDTYGELSFTAITAVDAGGHIVENAGNRVRVAVEGGTLLGLDNGDSTDYDQYKTDNRRLFNGRLMAIVRRDGGEKPRVTATLDDTDVPIRKIELTADGFHISAKTYPENATFTDLHWRLTDASGIDSILGRLTVSADGRSAVITPRGDGGLWVRCCAKNGKEHISLISQAFIEITGHGKPFIDPYTFVAGGLANRSNHQLAIGNERGVVSLPGGESHIGFADLDFGGYGSDELILPVFPLQLEPFEFEVWEGMPGEAGAERLLTVYYDKGSIWNTYQDVICKLPRRLRGVTTLCVVFTNKVHVKGFTFVRADKAFARLNAAENDGISGDNFTVCGSAVEGIGNNVSIVFNDMDFGETGAAGISLSARSALDQNSVQLLFKSEGHERREMLEVAGTAGYTESGYRFGEPVRGRQTVSLVFLPGTSMDLEWIRFEG
jgi:beta-galactosidase